VEYIRSVTNISFLRNPKIVEHCKYSGFKVSKCAVGADQKCKRKTTDFSKRKY
jgi:hypothetical protein